MKNLNTLFITEICGIYTNTFDKPCVHQMWDRPWYGLSFAISGQIIYHHNGHEYLSDPEHAILYPMHADYLLDCRIPGSFTLVNFHCADSFKLDQFVSIPLTGNTPFLDNHRHMEQLDYFHNPNQHHRFLALFYDSLSTLQDTITRQTLHPLIRSSLQYITEHLQEEQLNNTSIANQLGISPVYFRKLFEQNLHQPPMNYVQQLRLQKAKDFLAHTSDPVTSIACACGYSNIYHFCRIFKTKTGYTPTEYRKLHRIACL